MPLLCREITFTSYLMVFITALDLSFYAFWVFSEIAINLAVQARQQSTIVPHLELVTCVVRKNTSLCDKSLPVLPNIEFMKTLNGLSSCCNNEHHLAVVNRLKLIGSDIYWTSVWYCLLPNWHKAGVFRRWTPYQNHGLKKWVSAVK